MIVEAVALTAPPVRYIGAELMLMGLLRVLAARGHEVRVLGTEVDDPFLSDGVLVEPYHRSFDPDVTVYQASLGAHLSGPTGPRVALVHNVRAHTVFDLVNFPPEVVTANSRWSVRHLPRHDVIVHPPVPEPVALPRGDRVTLVNLDGNKVGRFWELVARMPDVPFLAVRGGYGSQVIPARLPANVEVLEHVPHEQMAELVWSRTAALLVPSRHESWSMTASEALAHGRPVIATELPGLRENVGTGGLLVGRTNITQWELAIRAVLGAPDLWESRALARAAEQRATWLAESSAWADRVEKEAAGV